MDLDLLYNLTLILRSTLLNSYVVGRSSTTGESICESSIGFRWWELLKKLESIKIQVIRTSVAMGAEVETCRTRSC